MVWTANIVLKSGKNIIVENLVSINTKNGADSSVKELKDFRTFHLSRAQRLSFVGSSSVASLMSDDIEYVELSEKN